MLKSKIAAVLYAASLGSREKLSHTTHFGLSSIFTCMSCPICLIYSSTNSSNFCKVRAAVSSSSEYVFFLKKTHTHLPSSLSCSNHLNYASLANQLVSVHCTNTHMFSHIETTVSHQNCLRTYIHARIYNKHCSIFLMHACMRCNDMIKNGWWYNSERGISRRERERDVSCCDLCGTNTRLENWFLTASGHAWRCHLQIMWPARLIQLEKKMTTFFA